MLIRIRNLNKSYTSETKTITRALEEINLDFKRQGLNFIVGESGSGKSTLLNIIGGIDTFDEGSIVVANHNLKNMKLTELDYYRNSIIGFVFQELNLLEDFNVRENIELAIHSKDDKKEEIDDIIKKLNLEKIENNNIKDISTGQKQRVAIARTIIKNAPIILADEPTGSLDSKNSEEVIQLLKDISKEKLVIVITHDLEMAKKYGDRIIELKDGKVINDIEKGLIKNNSVKVLDKSLIKIDKLDQEVVDKVNEIKEEFNQKVYICSEKSGRKVKALFKNAIFDENMKESDFKITQFSKEKMKKIPITKTKVELKNIFKLSLSNLFNKKKILILTSLLMIISLLLYGVSESLANYNKVDAYIETINEENLKSINFIEIKNKDNYHIINKENIQILEEKYKDINIAKEYLIPLKINLNKTVNGSKKYSLTGVSEVNDVSVYGYKTLEGKSVLSNYDEIIISEYFADVLIKGEYFYSLNNIKNLVDKEIKLNDFVYKIVGIIESDYLSNNKDDESNYLDIRDNLIFVKEGFLNNYFSTLKYVEYSLDIFLKDNNNLYDSEDLSIANIVFDDYESNSNLNFTFFSEEKTTLEENEILVSESYLNNNELCSNGCNASSFKNNELVLTYNSNVIYASNNYKVVGTYSFVSSDNEIDYNLYNNSIILSSLLKEKINKNIYYNYQILVELTENKDTNKSIINDCYDLGLSINKNFTSSYEKYSEMVNGLSDVLNTLSLIMLVISIVLLYSFIQNSILISKRKIGILKSLGVNNLNIFSIFLIETLLICLIVIIGSSSLLLITGPIINLVIRSDYGFYFSALNIEATIFLKLIFVTIIVSLIALIIPIIKLSKMSTNKLIGSR